jgi:hypothetical protein
VNASASALPREDEVQSKIGKVRTFSRYARFVCSAIFGFGLVGSVGGVLMAVFGSTITAPEHKAWVVLVVVVLLGVWLTAVYQLYRLFSNLAVGAIYTSDNVRRLRYVGLLSLVSAALGYAIPVGSAALVSLDFLDASFPFKSMFAIPSLSETLSTLISAGLILLASWIMDVGLYEKDHADALQRDADLVI